MTGLGIFEARTVQAVTNAKDYLTTWLEDESAQVSRKIGSLASDALDSVAVAAKTVQQDVDLGLSQYNAKVQKLADKAPGGLSQKIARFPWVTITVSLIFGFVLGMLLKPTRQFRELPGKRLVMQSE